MPTQKKPLFKAVSLEWVGHSYSGVYVGCGTDEFMVSIFELVSAEEKLLWRVVKRLGKRHAPYLAPDSSDHSHYSSARSAALQAALQEAAKLALPYLPDLEDNAVLSEGEFLQVLHSQSM